MMTLTVGTIASAAEMGRYGSSVRTSADSSPLISSSGRLPREIETFDRTIYIRT
jgi:hypothetical protein